MYFEREDIDRFCTSMGYVKKTPSYEHLVELILRFFDRVPFTNIMMLVRGRRTPTKSEITEDMLNFCGGPCGHLNPFFRDVLDFLGYTAYLVPGWMSGEMSHIALVVSLEDDYWVDVGNGHPYYTPLSMNKDNIPTHCGLSYKLESLGGHSFQILQRTSEDDEYSVNYKFEFIPVGLDFFDKMVNSHYTNDNFGPFRTSLRLIHYRNEKMVAVKDYELLEYSRGLHGKSMLSSNNEITESVKKHFNHFRYPVTQAITALGWDK
jgi:arylamine N-acetyltransferase